jgi:hypothetical protein
MKLGIEPTMMKGGGCAKQVQDDPDGLSEQQQLVLAGHLGHEERFQKVSVPDACHDWRSWSSLGPPPLHDPPPLPAALEQHSVIDFDDDVLQWHLAAASATVAQRSPEKIPMPPRPPPLPRVPTWGPRVCAE